MARVLFSSVENMTMESGVAALMRNPEHDLRAGPVSKIVHMCVSIHVRIQCKRV